MRATGDQTGDQTGDRTGDRATDRTARRTDTRDGREAPFGPGALLLLSIAAALIFSVVAYVITDRPPLIGIDDAAITRNYAENIANGHGFVYYVGGERVEGATSLLWTLMVAAAYLVTPEPELLITGLCGVFAALSVFAVLSLQALLAREFALPQRPAVGAALVGLAAMPGFFFWSVFTMMELALWSAAILLLVWRLARLVERPKPWSFGVVVLGFALPLIRPEGAAVALGLMALAALLMWRLPRGLIAAVLATVVSTVALLVFRLSYFGYPAPNTFYAKVSSDRLQDLADGVKYVFSFVTDFPFAAIMLIVWALAAIWAVARHFSARPDGAGGLIVAGCAILGVFAIYAVLGGDHFEYWRFLEPVAPLLTVAPALALTRLWIVMRRPPASSGTDTPSAAGWGAAATVAAALWIGVSWGDFRQSRFDLVKEFTLVDQGLTFGRLMNGFEPRPTLGIGPAGGIALGYDGPILDLLGLNWVEMAHANPVKTGMRNHASFDAATFWRRPPDLIAEFNRPCSKSAFMVRRVDENMTKGLYREPRFQEAYVPVRIEGIDRCWRGFARRGWVDGVSDPRVERVDWSDVLLLTSAREPPDVFEQTRLARQGGDGEKRG